MPHHANDHPTLLTPGPIETDDDVLLAMSHPSESHVGREFSELFGQTLRMLRKLLQAKDPASQPFVIAGSGTLGFDQVATNILEPGDLALVLNVGYWGDLIAECFRTYGVEADELQAPQIGGQPAFADVEKTLRAKKYKVITITHTDTTTGVLSDVKSIAHLVRTTSPDTLIVVDGVCSVGCEDIRFDEWNLDIVIGASQKALGAPAGLSIVMASARSLRVFEQRKSRPRANYASWAKWLPVMRSYESQHQQSLYLATPQTQLIRALHTSLTQILAVSFETRLQQHRDASRTVKDAIAKLGLKQLVAKPEEQANGMTAFWLPGELRAEHILPLLAKSGVVLARGPQKGIAGQYIRFAHMGVSVTDPGREDIQRGIKMLGQVLEQLRGSR